MTAIRPRRRERLPTLRRTSASIKSGAPAIAGRGWRIGIVDGGITALGRTPKAVKPPGSRRSSTAGRWPTGVLPPAHGRPRQYDVNRCTGYGPAGGDLRLPLSDGDGTVAWLSKHCRATNGLSIGTRRRANRKSSQIAGACTSSRGDRIMPPMQIIRSLERWSRP